MLKHQYVTRKDHGQYPAGTKCQAWRNEDNRLILEFPDGAQIELGPWFYLQDLEEPSAVVTSSSADFFLAH